MYDKGLSVLEQYGLEAAAVSRGRGALICDTKEGMVCLLYTSDIEDVVDLDIKKLDDLSSDEILDADQEQEIHLGDTQELDILDAVEDIADLEEFDEADTEEDEDSKLAMQISRLLSEEDEAMMEEELEDFLKE